MLAEDDLVEEMRRTVWARKGGQAGKRERPARWYIAKRGTIFRGSRPRKNVDIYKDITHLYRRRKSGKKKGRIEWATAFWIEGAHVQTLCTAAEVRDVFFLRRQPFSTLFNE